MGLLAAVLPVSAFTVAYCFLARWVNRRLERGPANRPFPVASCMLVAVATWTVGAVALATLLPGGAGPVQYAAGSPIAMLIFHQRIGTILAMFLTPFIAAVIGLARVGRRPIRWRSLCAAVTFYAIAAVMLVTNLWFWPMV
jgi:hypothetical protein